jgi:hypothetical protein
MSSTESIPQTWDEERDGRFFRITAALFGADFCYGAGVLLASYDEDVVPAQVTRQDPGPSRGGVAAVGAPDRASTDPTSYAA